ncbi:MAG: gamma-glutamyl-gamma-aminobutyrate hydrolase family protein [Planctomycetota bacterium]|nr:gamma-glutamyl-gamma-aminobutyrate hydrolase family protein [Planctomycetota bacterium]
MSICEDLRFLLLQARLPGDVVREEERAAFAQQLAVDLEQVIPLDIFETSPTASHRDDVNAILVGGSGDYGVVNPIEPIQAMIRFVADTAQSGFPMFASCFGFQAMVVGLGGSVIEDHKHTEVGTCEVRRLATADGDPLFNTLPEHFTAQMGHKDRADRLPEGVVNMVESERCPYQAIKIEGTPVYATQFHPELSGDDNRRRFKRYRKEYGTLFGEEEAQALLEGCRPSPQANALLSRFVDEFLA